MQNKTKLSQNVWMYEKLGSGKQGQVFRGVYQNEEHSTIIAIKEVQKTKHGCRQLKIYQYFGDQKYHHPNIVKFYAKIHKNDKIYICIQYCQQGSLQDYINKHKFISEDELIDIAYQLLDALTFIHSHNVMHRDIKPENILLDQNNNIKIVDYGLARDIDIDHTLNAGSPYYQAPEILQGSDKYDDKVDVWSLGVMLYQLVTQKILYDIPPQTSYKKSIEFVKQKQIKLHFKKWICEVPNYLHKQWETFIDYLLKYDPRERPSLKQAFQKFKEIRKVIRSDNKKKYQLSDICTDFTEKMASLDISSPYKPNAVKEIFQEPQKIAQSYNNVFELKKYLLFTLSKAKSSVIFMNKLNSVEDYPLKQQYKLSLILIALSIAKIKLMLINQAIKSGIIITTNFSFLMKTVHKYYQQEAKKIFQQFQQYCTKSINVSCNDNIIYYCSKLSNCWWGKQKQQRDIIEKYPFLLQLVQMKSNWRGVTQNKLQMKYECLIEDQQVYIPNQKLQECKQSHLQVYCLIRILGNMDEIFPQTLFKQLNIVNTKLYSICKMRKQKLIEFIKSINSKKK